MLYGVFPSFSLSKSTNPGAMSTNPGAGLVASFCIDPNNIFFIKKEALYDCLEQTILYIT